MKLIACLLMSLSVAHAADTQQRVFKFQVPENEDFKLQVWRDEIWITDTHSGNRHYVYDRKTGALLEKQYAYYRANWCLEAGVHPWFVNELFLADAPRKIVHVPMAGDFMCRMSQLIDDKPNLFVYANEEHGHLRASFANVGDFTTTVTYPLIFFHQHAYPNSHKSVQNVIHLCDRNYAVVKKIELTTLPQRFGPILFSKIFLEGKECIYFLRNSPGGDSQIQSAHDMDGKEVSLPHGFLPPHTESSAGIYKKDERRSYFYDGSYVEVTRECNQNGMITKVLCFHEKPEVRIINIKIPAKQHNV